MLLGLPTASVRSELYGSLLRTRSNFTYYLKTSSTAQHLHSTTMAFALKAAAGATPAVAVSRGGARRTNLACRAATNPYADELVSTAVREQRRCCFG